MYERTFQYRVAVSSASLPVALALTAMAWLPGDWTDWRRWAGLAAVVVMAYFVALWNNVHMLLRIRSRLVSSTFLLLVAACPFLHRWSTDWVPAACAIGVYYCLFRAYQKSHPEPDVFHAFVFLGVGSFFFPQWLCFVPVLWGALLVRLRAFTSRSFVASLLGLVLAYWAFVAYAAWHNRLDTAFGFWLDAWAVGLPDYGACPLPCAVSFAFVSFYLAVSAVHFSRTAFYDRIRVRMYYRLLITQAVLLGVAIVAQPRHFGVAFPLYVVTASPVVGHYFALARGRFMNVWFIASLLLLGGLYVFNFVAPWTSLSTYW